MALLNPTDVLPPDLVEGDVVTDCEGLPYAVTGVQFAEWPYGKSEPRTVFATLTVEPLAPIPGTSWRPMEWRARRADEPVRVLIRAWDRAPYARAYGRISGRSDAQVMFACGALAVREERLTW